MLAAPSASCRALLLLLCENALRRAERHQCNVADFQPTERRLAIRGKGRGSQQEPITLSPVPVAALTAHLAARTLPDMPLEPATSHIKLRPDSE